MIYCTPWEEKVCAKVCKSNHTPFPAVRPGCPKPTLEYGAMKRPELSIVWFLEEKALCVCVILF